MLQLILGRAGSGKTAHAMQVFRSKMSEGARNLYFIVPEQYSHDAERQLLGMCGDTLSLHGEVLSFSRLTSRVFSELGGIGSKNLDNGGRLLLMSRAVSSLSGRLRIYGGSEQTPAFLEKLAAVSKEFKSACLSPEALGRAAQASKSPLREKLGDLSLILGAYDAFFTRDTANPDDRLDRLARMIGASDLFEGGHIFLDGFTDFTAQELRVIEALLKKDADMTVCLTCDGMESQEEIFQPARGTAVTLLRLAANSGTESGITVLPASNCGRADALCFLEKNLFTYRPETYVGDGSAVGIYAAQTADDECEFAAAEALKLLKKGYRLRDIAVAVCDWQTYGALAEDVFKKYNVPVFVSGKTDIGQKPPVYLIEKALEIVIEGWEYEAVFACLKTGLTGVSLADCDILENYVLKWNLRGTIWTRDEDWSFPPSGYERDTHLDEAALLERINTIRRTVAGPLKKLQAALRSSETFGDKLRALYGFMEEIRLPERIAQKSAALRSLGEIQLADTYDQLWELLVRALDQFYDILGETAGSNAEFLRLWKLLVSQYDMGSIPVALDRISLGDLSRIRRRGCKCLIVIGATDDALPPAGGGGLLLSDSERRELNILGLPLSGTAEERLYRALNTVYSALTIPTDSLIVSYARTGPGGEEKRPSFVVRRLLALFSQKARTEAAARCRLLAAAPAFELAAASLQDAENKLAAAAAEYFTRDPAAAERLRRIARAAKLRRADMTALQAARLYGSALTVSASRIDKFYACRYQYFLQYGLAARPRKPAGFDAPTAGTFMHYVLENAAKDILSGPGYKNVGDAQCLALTQKYVARYAAEFLDNFKDKSSRFRYLFDRLAGDAALVVLDMVRELAVSDFVPLDFELEFSENGQVPPHVVAGEGGEVKVKGFVDRVDGWEHDGKLYLRVVDYKTGKKNFSLSDVLNGMNMQMLIYLFALTRSGGIRPGIEPVPAGVLYTPAREELVQASRYDSSEKIASERAKRLRRSGLILADGAVVEAMEHGERKLFLPVKAGGLSGDSVASAEQLGALSRHIDKMLLEIAQGVGSGDLAAEPYFKNRNDNACLYCDFQAACHFSVADGDRRRFFRKIKAEDAWEKLMGEDRA